MAFSNLTSDYCSNPSLVISRRRFSLSSSRRTIFSPHSVGRQFIRKSNCLARPPNCIFSMMRPSWQTLFADVQFGHDLDARRDGVLQLERWLHDVLQHTV